MPTGRQVRNVTFTPTLDTSAYAAGDQMSTLQTVDQILSSSGQGSELVKLVVLDKAKQSSALDIFFFTRPVTLVAADQSPADISDADMEFCIGVINVAASDYDNMANSSIATLVFHMSCHNPGRSDQAAPGAMIPRHRLYANLVCRGTPTYAAGSLVITLTSATEEG